MTSAPPPLSAEPNVSHKTQHYLVDGTTAEAIRKEVKAKAATTDDVGKQFFKFTKWNVSWRTTSRRNGKQCGVKKIATSVHIEYFLPKLKPNPDRPAEVAAQWNRYIKALVARQVNHGKFAIAAAREIERLAPSIPSQASCEKLGEVVSMVSREILKKYRKLDARYSQQTRSGGQ